MTPDRYQQIKRVYQAAEDLPPDQRREYLAGACNGDIALRQAVEQLCAASDEGETLLPGGAEGYAAALFESACESPLGRRIGRYEVLRELGAGGMGRVYLAVRSDDFRKTVALKILRAGADSDMLIRRFCVERQILAALDHPNIARLVDGGATEQGAPYLVMDYIDGLPIDEYCDANRLSIDERLGLFLPICAAVQHAHRNLIVHRDLKPGNILVQQDGIPKLLDFGIAKLLGSEIDAVTRALTAVDVHPMTPRYASPEQLLGLPITTASDVYSLGVVLYELLTGHTPFESKTGAQPEPWQIARNAEPTRPSTAVTRDPERIAQARRTQPDKLRRRLSGDLDTILLRTLDKEPERRYATVEEFAGDIRLFLEGRPVRA